MKRMILLTGILLIIHGCVKETTWTLKEGLPVTLVVDAIITDEVKQHKVTLSRPFAALNQAPEPVIGANLLISNEDSAWQMTEDPTKPGIYLTPSYFHAITGKNYTLLIQAGDTIYTAKATVIPGAIFTELRYLQNPDNNLFYIDWVANAFSSQQAAMWEVLIDWSAVPGYEQFDSLDNHARLLFYTLPTLDVSEVFAPMMESTYFPAGATMTERRYSLTNQHAGFIREMLLETNWTGGLFPEAPANVSTNLSGGAFGYFGVCAVTELSIIVK